ncbi:MAG TPA: pseudouridine-5'-phosphate glycosidase [Candidatus Dormibacteraeota bacterium]|nr:pseudouridine-5'-phosphate glycosidase [Candidatus Dormibacteraeota bacterium]
MPTLSRSALRLAPEVAAALAAGRPVVALETAIVAHGLPRPINLEVGRALEAEVRAGGAVPATIGVLGGRPTIGLTDAELEHLATAPAVTKLSDRDLAVAMARGVDGSATVAATLVLAAAVGIEVLATGGLGGVHRGARESWDVSADLLALRREPVLVVAAGVKSVLDVPATLEQLETLGVPVIGYRTHRFPGFLLTDSGCELTWSVGDAAEAAAVVRAGRRLHPSPSGVLLANPVDPAHQLDPAWHDRLLAAALAEMEAQGIRGKAVTPFLLGHMEAATGGESVRVNRHLVLANARLAAAVAAALAAGEPAAAPQPA